MKILGVLKRLLLAVSVVTIVAAVLLLSDLDNRKPPESKADNSLLSKKSRICLLQYSAAPLSEETKTGVIEGFREAGLVEGKDFDLKHYNANGDIATLNSILDNVLAENYDVLIVSSTPTLQAAIKKIKKTPIVFTAVADPIIAGGGKSFKEHLPNVAGISTLGDFEKFIKIVKAIQPDIKNTGTLYSPSEINSVKNLELFKKYAGQNGVAVRETPIFSSNEVVDAAHSLCSKKIEAVTQIIDNQMDSSFATIINAARHARIPIYAMSSKHAADGAVATVARDYVQAGKDAVRLTLRILKGENPAKIPFEYASKTVITLNRTAGKFYSLRFPPDVVKRADKIIGDDR